MHMKNNETITTTLSWIEDLKFIKDSERAAESLALSFPLSKAEALTIVIVKAMHDHNAPVSKRAVSEALAEQFGISFTASDLKSVERIFDIITAGTDMTDSNSFLWFSYLWKDVALSSVLQEADDIYDCNDIADFYEIDKRAIHLIKHAISSKSPVAISINGFALDMSLGIIKQLFEKEGIRCMIGSKVRLSET